MNNMHKDKHKHKHKHKDKDEDLEDENDNDIEDEENDNEIEYDDKNDVEYVEVKNHTLDKGTVCQLINASIEEEAKAGHDYVDILEVIPPGEEYEDCAKAITEIMEDEINHALTLMKIGKKLGCKKPDLKRKDEELLKIVSHIHKIEID